MFVPGSCFVNIFGLFVRSQGLSRLKLPDLGFVGLMLWHLGSSDVLQVATLVPAIEFVVHGNQGTAAVQLYQRPELQLFVVFPCHFVWSSHRLNSCGV